MPISRRTSSARSRISSLDRLGSCCLIVSSKCCEIRIKGFSRVSGSWKIIPSSPPRSPYDALEPSEKMSRPRKRTSPSRLAPSGSNPISPRPSVDLPHPDSPTSPSVSPGARSKLTPSTARIAPRVVPYQTRTSRAEITGPSAGTGREPSVRSTVMSALLLRDRGRRRPGRHHHRQQPAPPQRRVERLVEALADQGQPDHQEHDGQSRIETGPPHPGAGIGQ